MSIGNHAPALSPVQLQAERVRRAVEEARSVSEAAKRPFRNGDRLADTDASSGQWVDPSRFES